MKISKAIQQLLITSTLLSLAGCSYFMPTNEKPDTPLPTKWEKANVNHIDLTQYAWWKEFNDPTLNQLVNDALIHNNQIKIAMANVLAAQADLDKAKYSWIPTLGASGRGFVGQAFGVDFTNKSGNPALDGLANKNVQTFGGGLGGISINYNLNIMQLYHAEKIADLNMEIQQQIKKAANLSIINQVTVAYFSLLAAKQQVNIQENIVSVEKEIAANKKRAFELGAINETQVDQANQDLANAESQLSTLKYDIGKYENVLRLLTDQNPGKIKTENQILNLNPKNIPAGLPSTVLENRPDIVMSEYQLELANANIGLARSEFFPSIDLTSFVGGASLALNNLFTVGTGLWTAQAALNIPVLNMSTFADSDKAEAQYKAAYYNYIDTVKSAFSQVDDSLNYYGYINKSLASQDQVLLLANKQYHASERKYELGSISKTQTLMQQIQLDHARLGQLQIKSAQLTGLAMAYQALAAGYNTKITEAQKTAKEQIANTSSGNNPAQLSAPDQGKNHQKVIDRMMEM